MSNMERCAQRTRVPCCDCGKIILVPRNETVFTTGTCAACVDYTIPEILDAQRTRDAEIVELRRIQREIELYGKPLR